MRRTLLAVLTVTALVAVAAMPAVADDAADDAVDKSDNIEQTAQFAYAAGTDIDYDGERYVYAGALGQETGGVHVIDIAGKKPKKVAFIPCPGEQNDVAVVRPGLLALGYHSGFCAGGAPSQGVRLIDVRNPKRPKFLGEVALPSGTHTVTTYPGKPIIYATPGGLANGGGVEQIIDVSNPKKPVIAGTFRPNPAGCHDISFLFQDEEKLAFCAGGGEVQVWDVSDPFAPVTIGHIVNPLVQFPHTAVPTPDGQYLVVSDEAIVAHECASGRSTTGSMYVYDIRIREAPIIVGHIPPQRGNAPIAAGLQYVCTAHNMNFVPGTRTMVSSWYTAGTRVFDLSNPTLPTEIAHYTADDADTWSSYWFDGRIFTNDQVRGLEILEVDGLKEGKGS